MYEKVPGSMNFVEREKGVRKFWEDNQIFEKTVSRPIPSLTARLPQTASRTSATC